MGGIHGRSGGDSSSDRNERNLSKTERSYRTSHCRRKKHGMRYTQYKGLAKVTMELTLIFACINLKKLAIRK